MRHSSSQSGDDVAGTSHAGDGNVVGGAAAGDSADERTEGGTGGEVTSPVAKSVTV